MYIANHPLSTGKCRVDCKGPVVVGNFRPTAREEQKRNKDADLLPTIVIVPAVDCLLCTIRGGRWHCQTMVMVSGVEKRRRRNRAAFFARQDETAIEDGAVHSILIHS
jgi:hypothetical protein